MGREKKGDIHLLADGWHLFGGGVDGDVREKYVWSAAYVDALVARDRDLDLSGNRKWEASIIWEQKMGGRPSSGGDREPVATIIRPALMDASPFPILPPPRLQPDAGEVGAAGPALLHRWPEPLCIC